MSRKVTSLWVLAAVLLFSIPVTAQHAVKKAAVKKFSAHKMLTNIPAEKVKEQIEFQKILREKEKAVEIMPQIPLRNSDKNKTRELIEFTKGVELPVKGLSSRTSQYETMRIPLRAGAAEGEIKDEHGIITAPAEGTHKYYTRSGKAYYTSNSQMYIANQSGKVEIVETEDGTIYIKDPISRYNKSSWVKGTKSGNTITVPARQPLVYNSQYDTTISLRWGSITASGSTVATDSYAENFTYTIEGDVISLQGTEEYTQGTAGGYFQGAFWDDDQSATGYGDYNTVYTLDESYTPPTTDPVVAPEGLVTELWNASLDDVKKKVTIGFSGNDVYVKGLFEEFPDAWIKGTISGMLVTFPSMQYLGAYQGNSFWAVGATGSTLAPFEMFYDDQAKEMSSANTLLANAAEDRIYYLERYENVIIQEAEFPEEEAKTGDNIETLPYENSFTTNDEQGVFGILDANGDKKTWSFSTKGVASYKYNTASAADDWLISPAIKLEAGKKYSFAIDAYAESNKFPERLEVTFGKEAKVSALKDSVIPVTDIDWMKPQTLSNTEISVSETGYYHFGIHAISDKNMYQLYVDNFVVEATPEPTAPDTVTDVKITPATLGALEATLDFKAPAKAVNGTDLTSNLTKIEIYRNDVLAKTIENVAPGSSQSWKDTGITASGFTTYRIRAYNTDGFGKRSVRFSAYVGIDVPLPVEEVDVVDNQTSVTFNWEKVGNAGLNNGYVKTSEVDYTVWSVEYVSLFGVTFPLPAEQLDSVRDATTSTIEFNTEEGDEQEYVSWAVIAKNEMGEADPVYTSPIIVGKPYDLPLEESFEGKQLHYFWLNDNTDLGVSSSSSDGDGVAFLMTTEDGGEGAFISGKLNLKPAANPTLLFDVKSESTGSKLTIKGSVENGDPTTLVAAVPVTTGFSTIKIPLNSIKNGRYSTVGFYSDFVNEEDSFVIDNIKIVDLYEYNLSAKVEAPDEVQAGDTALVKVTVRNEGENPASDYTVTLKAGDKVLLNENVKAELAPFTSKEFTVKFATTKLDDEAEVTLKAEVAYDLDLEPDDNASETLINIVQPKVASPENVKGSQDGTGIALTWSAPNVLEETVTEGFDDTSVFPEFSLAGITKTQHQGTLGDWTFYDGNGVDVYSLDGINVPNFGDPAAWMVFAPGSSELEEDLSESYSPHSGTQFLLSSCPAEGTPLPAADHWLISPKLNGKAQEISFYARELSDEYGDETYEILVSSTDKNIESFTLLGSEHTVTSKVWTLQTADLPEGTKYFAIRHTSEDIFGLLIDDITYTTGGGEIDSYNIYVDGVKVNSVAAGTYSYTVTPGTADKQYAVSAVYTNGLESKPIVALVITDNIADIIAVNDGKPVDIYTLDGKLVRREAKSLEGLKGLYMVGKQKVFVK